MDSNPRGRPPTRDGTPEELRERKRWVCWRLVEREGGRTTKEPINPSYTGRKADVTDPLTWSTHKHASAVRDMHPHLDGVGFVFEAGDPYCGIDFDGCIGEDGEITPWAASWIERLGGYAERSPSGTGVHVIVKAKLPGRGRNNRARKVEIYDRERFFTMTGWSMGTDAPVDAQETVDALLLELYPPRKEKEARRLRSSVLGLSDEEVLQRARRSRNGRKFRLLHDEGNWKALGYPSQSEGDQAEVSILVFWTHGDGDQVARLFEGGALYRKGGKGRDYVARTVDAVLSDYRGAYYDPGFRDPKIVPVLRKIEALLEAPIWRSRRAPIARAALTTFFHDALEYGQDHKGGVVVSISVRKLAEKSGTTPTTIRKSALPELVKMGLLKWHSTGKGKRSSSFLLRVPRSYHTSSSHAYSVITTNVDREAREQLSRLRSGWSRFARMSRVSKTCELPLTLILAADRQTLTFRELVKATGRSASSVGRSMKSLVGANLVAETDPGTYRLGPDFWDRFDEVLRASGVTQAENRQKVRHEHDRLTYAGWIQRWIRGEEVWLQPDTRVAMSRAEALSRVGDE